MVMFLNKYEHSIDLKGRMALPAKFRAQFEGGQYYGCTSLRGCIYIYSEEEFRKYITGVEEYTDEDARLRVATSAFGDDFDTQGRILIPAENLKMAGIDKKAIVAGNIDHIEIWNPDSFARHVAEKA